MSIQSKDYLSARAMMRIDQEYTLLIRRAAQREMMEKIHARGLPIVSSDHRPERDRVQVHQKWPWGAMLFFARQPVIRRPKGGKH